MTLLAEPEAPSGTSRGTTIAAVEVIRIREPRWTDFPWWITNPMDVFYDDEVRERDRRLGLFNAPVGSRTDPVFMVIVRVRTHDGRHGLGGIGLGSEAVAQIVTHQLTPLVIGKSPFDVEALWERMFRGTVNIGRRGLVLEAISGVDIALWDLMGKITGQPVYNLLGGRTRQKIRCYASGAYAREDLNDLKSMIAGYVKQGFTAVKMRFGYGPRDGRAGMRKNVALVQTVREALGPDRDLMGDAYMGWDTQYTIEMLRMLEEFDLTWMEEPVMPDNIDGYARIRAVSKIAIAGGEHEFTRWGFRQLIDRGAVDYLQPDVNRLGGVTEARKVWALAAGHNLPVVPHMHNFHNLHLIMAHMHSPMAEYLGGHGRDGDTLFSELFIGEKVPVDGHITLSDAPGFGVELNEPVIKELEVR